jgi:outer membrane scaffolding protein for murein synthesis (MipA/OmpV family)
MPRHLPALATAFAAACMMVPSPSAYAQNGIILIDAVPETTEFAFGPSLAAYPKFPGSDKIEYLPLPGVDLYIPQGGFVSVENGVGWNFSRSKDWQYGLRLWPQFGRKETDAPELHGLGDIGFRLEGCAFLNYSPWEFLILQSGLRYGSGIDRDGLLGELGATIGAPIGKSLLIGLTLAGTWANEAYRQSYFGISAEQSARSGRPAYLLGAGGQDANVGISLEYRIAPNWRFDGQVNVARLLGAAADSPITQARNQSAVLATAYYEFH